MTISRRSNLSLAERCRILLKQTNGGIAVGGLGDYRKARGE